MANKLKLDSNTHANKQFKITPKGYDGFEVDSLFDEVVKDYELVENSVLLSKGEYEALSKKIEELNKQVIEKTIELKKEKDRNKFIQDGKRNSLDNYELLLRIGKLEKIINEKLHLSLEEIDSFDPDDC